MNKVLTRYKNLVKSFSPSDMLIFASETFNKYVNAQGDYAFLQNKLRQLMEEGDNEVK